MYKHTNRFKGGKAQRGIEADQRALILQCKQDDEMHKKGRRGKRGEKWRWRKNGGVKEQEWD